MQTTMTPNRIKSPDSDPGGADTFGENPETQDEPDAARASRFGAVATSQVEVIGDAQTEVDEATTSGGVEHAAANEPLAIRGMIAGMRHHLRPRRQ